MKVGNKSEARRQKRRKRIRGRLSGSSTRPRLAVFKSLKHIYAQVIDDSTGSTIAHASTQDEGFRKDSKFGGNISAAELVGTTIADRLKEKGLQNVVFDRGGYRYQGRIKAIAEAARKAGVKI